MAVERCARRPASAARPDARDSPAMWSSRSATTTGERRRKRNRAGSGSVHPTAAGPARVATGPAWRGRRRADTRRGVRCERRELLDGIRPIARRTLVRMPAVQDDGFEAVAAVIAAILEDGHDTGIIGTPNAECLVGAGLEAQRSRGRAQKRESHTRTCGFCAVWWTAGGSNSRPPRCERGALPAELAAHILDLTPGSPACARSPVSLRSRRPNRKCSIPDRCPR